MSKGQRPRSHGYENRHGRTVASDACCYGRVLLLPAWVCMSIRLPMFSSSHIITYLNVASGHRITKCICTWTLTKCRVFWYHNVLHLHQQQQQRRRRRRYWHLGASAPAPHLFRRSTRHENLLARVPFRVVLFFVCVLRRERNWSRWRRIRWTRSRRRCRRWRERRIMRWRRPTSWSSASPSRKPSTKRFDQYLVD